MSDDFDPYYKWLAIPPEEQPPNYYRLLGLRLFESDHDVIGNAADARMLQIRSYQSGARAKESQRILKEISAARVCLLRAETREEYDAGLRSELRVLESGDSESPAPLPAVPPADRPPASAAAAPPLEQERSVRVRSAGTIAPPVAEERVVADPMVVAAKKPRVGSAGVRARRKSNPLIPIAILAAVALALVFVAIRLTGSESIQLKVKSIDDRTVRMGEAFSVRAQIVDDEHWQDGIRWRLEDPPTGARIDRESGEVTWEPRRAGKFSFRVIATSIDNDSDEDYEDFKVEVLRGKSTRNGTSRSTSRALRIAAIQDREVSFGDSVSFFIPVSNTPKDAKVRFRIVGDAPDGAEVDPETGMFSWRPDQSVSPGEYAITVAAEAAGRASAKRDFSITVAKPDGLASWPPRVRDIADQSAAPGETVRVQVRARDWNRPPQELKYDLDFPPEGATIDAKTGEFTWTPGDVYSGRSVPITVRVTQVEARRSTTREFKVHITGEPSDRPPPPTVDENGIRTLTGLGGSADGVAVSKRGDLVAAGSVEGKLCVWSTETGKLLHELDVQPGALNSVVFSHDGALVAAGGGDQTVRIWDVSSGEKRQELTGLPGAVRTIKFAPGDQYVAAASSSATDVLLWQVAQGELQRTFKPGGERANDFVLCIAFRPDAGRLAAGRLSKTISIWDSRSGREERSIESGLVSALAYRTDNRLLVTADLSRKLVFREIGTGEPPIEKALEERPTALVFSQDGQALAVLLSAAGLAPSTKKVQIWNVDQRRAEATLDDAGMRVRGLAFADDSGSVVLVGTKDKDVLVRTWKPGNE